MGAVGPEEVLTESLILLLLSCRNIVLTLPPLRRRDGSAAMFGLRLMVCFYSLDILLPAGDESGRREGVGIYLNSQATTMWKHGGEDGILTIRVSCRQGYCRVPRVIRFPAVEYADLQSVVLYCTV